MKQNRLDSILNTENVEKNFKSFTLSFTVHDGTHTHTAQTDKRAQIPSQITFASELNERHRV